MKRMNRWTAAAAAWGWMAAAALGAGMCAEVQVEIAQTMTLERQGFDAMMRIHNGVTMYPLEDVNIRLTFKDAEGDAVSATGDPANTNAFFFQRVDTLDGIAGITNGTVGGGQTAEIHWLIIPSIKAGGTNENGAVYYIGAELSYTINGETEELTVEPDYIVVRPLPKLRLDYFLPGTVYGDDPWTEEIEPEVPFPLGVRVKNSGAGPAWKLKIESAQPKITENKQGLLVGFKLQGADVQGEGVANTLTVDFGTVPPSESKVAKWMMTSSLFGTFTNFTASFTHADDLGGELTSLIEEVRTHHLLKDVRVDLAGRDWVYDFLADDEGTVTAFESDGADLSVTNGSAEARLTGTDAYLWRLDTAGNDGASYVKKAFDGATNDNLAVAYVVRDDGKKLDVSNVWLHKTRESGENPWEGWLSLFDADGAGHSYIAVFTDIVAESNRPPTLQFIPDKVMDEGDDLEFLVEASDADGTVPKLAAFALPDGAEFLPEEGNGRGWFRWTAGEGSHGVYPVRFTATDGEYETFRIMKIYVGEPGEERCGNTVPQVPCSLEGWDVEIADVIGTSSSGNATVQWASVEGMAYDMYISDDEWGTNMNWTLSKGGQVGTGDRTEAVDEELGTGRVSRFYRLVLAGEDPTSSNAWGIIRCEIPASTYGLMAAPLRLDRRFSGRLGAALAESLEGSDEGVGAGGGAVVYLFGEDGAWRSLYLDRSGRWRDDDGQETDAELAPGQGFWVSRQGAGTVRATFAGQVGNDESERVALRTGYNLIGVAEGRSLPLRSVLDAAHPVGGANVEEADCAIFLDEDGTWRTLMCRTNEGGGTSWVDLGNDGAELDEEETLEPGMAFYYLRRGEATELEF